MIWVLLLFCFNLFWLSWVFVAACGPSLVSVSMSISILRVWWLLLLQGKWAPGQMGSVVVMHGCSCLAASGIFLDQGLNPCPLHWQQILNLCSTREALQIILDRTKLSRIILVWAEALQAFWIGPKVF